MHEIQHPNQPPDADEFQDGQQEAEEEPTREAYASKQQQCGQKLAPRDIRRVLSRCAERGVELKWFGADEPVAFTSRYDHWAYAGSARFASTDAILAGLIDMRLPLTFNVDDARLIARIIAEEVTAIHVPA